MVAITEQEVEARREIYNTKDSSVLSTGTDLPSILAYFEEAFSSNPGA
jgi:hypothetical protein